MKKYFKSTKEDLRAGLVVALVAIPLCLGISLASGAPLLSGLMAGIIGGLVVGSLSNSHLSVSGPAAGLAVVVLNAISDLGDFRVFLLAVFLSGLIQITFGLFKGGIISYFIPNSVIKGMLAAIGILIAYKQIPYVIGYQSSGESVHQGALLIGALSFAFLFAIEKTRLSKMKVFSLVPPVLFAVVFATLGSQLVTLDSSLLVNIGKLNGPGDFFASLTTPDWSAISNPQVWKIAAVLALVASIETLLCIEAADKMDSQKRVTSTNRELFAQGSGNLLSGLVGGLPITSVVVRSSVNANSGAKTKMSAIYHGCFLLFSVLAIPAILNKIPLAVLAAILVLTGIKLNPISLYKEMWLKGHQQSIPFFATIIGVVSTDLLTGVFIGLGFSIFMILKENYMIQSFALRPEVVHDGESKGAMRLMLAEYNSYLTRGSLQRVLNNIDEGKKIIINTSRVVSIDHDVIEVIKDFVTHAQHKNIEVEFQGTELDIFREEDDCVA